MMEDVLLYVALMTAQAWIGSSILLVCRAFRKRPHPPVPRTHL